MARAFGKHGSGIDGDSAMKFGHLEGLFNPLSIAIIGASENFQKVSGRPLMFLQKHRFQGTVYPINPKVPVIAGYKCYPHIDEVQDPVDLAVIVVPAKAVLEALKDCADKGVKAAVIITSGFAEVGEAGRAVQQKIRDLARETGMRILGPNIVGMHNLASRAIASISQSMEVEELVAGPIGFISQSGAYGTAICAWAQRDRIGLKYFVSCGNEADIEFSECVAYMAEDPEVKVIAGYIEGLKDGKNFKAVADRALQIGKPIVLLKVGRSAAGARAATSHTGAITGSDACYEALFKQKGIIRVENVEELLDCCNTFAISKIPKGKNVAILTMSGGAAIQMADKCEELGLQVPEIGGNTVERLKEMLPGFSATSNPVDLSAQFSQIAGGFKNCVKVLADDDRIDVITVFLNLIWTHWQTVAEQLIEAAKLIDKPLAVVWIEGKPEAIDLLKRNQVLVFSEPIRCVKAIASLIRYHEFRDRRLIAGKGTVEPDKALSHDDEERKRQAIRLIETSQGMGRNLLTERETKILLRMYGIPVTREELARTPEEALACAKMIGYPVALKIESPDIAHKTEAGAIRLGIGSETDLRKAYEEILAASFQYNSKARIEGMLVQEMVDPGTEVIIGMTKDSQIGATILFGLGGIFVEILKDVSLRTLPISEAEAMEMIQEIKGFPILGGYRGKSPMDLAALADILLKVARLSTDLETLISELDINPIHVFAKGKGAVAVDALMAIRSDV